jgi:DNA-binding response OmpR family regulator
MTNGLEPDRVTARPVSPADARSRRETVLIVTGDCNLGVAATRVLEQEAYDVVTARHAGHAFLAALTETRIDVLISELTLDDMTGEDLATTLRRYHPELRSLYIADEPAPQEQRILVRPFTKDELLRELSSPVPPATSKASGSTSPRSER